MEDTRGTPAAQDWEAERQELAWRREQAAAMGGPEALAKHKARGRLNARERIALLCDAGSFRELGRIAGKGRYDADGFFQSLSPVNAIIGSVRLEGQIGRASCRERVW